MDAKTKTLLSFGIPLVIGGVILGGLYLAKKKRDHLAEFPVVELKENNSVTNAQGEIIKGDVVININGQPKAFDYAVGNVVEVPWTNGSKILIEPWMHENDTVGVRVTKNGEMINQFRLA
jgi:hypothetical protein